jgi:DNA-binding transcriptional MocR family regulator
VRDLASGNPDPEVLPPLGPALARIGAAHKLYGGPAILPQLAEIARADFAADGITGEVAVVSGALDGIERALQAELRPGDRVAVEDPGWPRIGDLVTAIGLRPEPVAVDQHGPVPDGLAAALQAGARAVIATPRGQNPTGAVIDARRAAQIQAVLAAHPQVLVIEDDYIAAIAGVPYAAVHGRSDRWAVVRSVSKVLGPDLRLATLAADPLTLSRVAGRQLLGPGWVSHLLQQTAATMRSDATTRGLLAHAEQRYAVRRAALVAALAERGIGSHGRSGLGVWIPVEEEAAIVQALAERGWAVGAGERFRYRTAPGIRVTTTTLQPDEAERLADDIAAAIGGRSTTYAG